MTADPYGLEYGDWEDPHDHVFLTMCTGCGLCASWEGRLVESIRADRRTLVARWRAGEGNPPQQRPEESGDMTVWKWDADRDHPLTQRGIPVTSAQPEWGYFAVFDGGSPAQPTQREEEFLLSYIAYVRSYYAEPMVSMGVHEDTFGWVPGYNTAVFHKYADNDWAFRRRLWATSRLLPLPPGVSPRGPGPLSLVELLNRVCGAETTGMPHEKWVSWKREHPEVFG